MLKLTGIFQDNMVIRRNKPIQVWGTGTPNTIVTVSLFTATAIPWFVLIVHGIHWIKKKAEIQFLHFFKCI